MRPAIAPARATPPNPSGLVSALEPLALRAGGLRIGALADGENLLDLYEHFVALIVGHDAMSRTSLAMSRRYATAGMSASRFSSRNQGQASTVLPPFHPIPALRA
jgi:hypothetical protein